MTKMNPIRKSAYINEQYKEYLRFSFHFGDEKIQQLFYEALDKEVLFKGPYVDMVLPFKKGAAIDDLIEEGTVSPLFRKLGNIDFKRPLYIHQEKSLRHVGSGRSAVITTGTGSGKTESFLYPILNDILRDIEQGKDHGGIRAVFLYPMNALVNDQIDRVRTILKDYPEITFGRFTGETEETKKKGRLYNEVEQLIKK